MKEKVEIERGNFESLKGFFYSISQTILSYNEEKNQLKISLF